jgi:hypothetical protein
MTTKNSIQPVNHGGGRGAGIPKYNSGSSRSVARLRNLGFDPIGELVAKYRKLEVEVEYQEKIRDGSVVALNNAGRPRAYNADTHYALYDKLINISEKLLRYNYGRVPEIQNEAPKAPTPLVINLTKKGDTYVINEEAEDIQPEMYLEGDDDEDSRP